MKVFVVEACKTLSKFGSGKSVGGGDGSGVLECIVFVGCVCLEVWFVHVTEGVFPIRVEDGYFKSVKFVEEVTNFFGGIRHLFFWSTHCWTLVKDVGKVVVFDFVA